MGILLKRIAGVCLSLSLVIQSAQVDFAHHVVVPAVVSGDPSITLFQQQAIPPVVVSIFQSSHHKGIELCQMAARLSRHIMSSSRRIVSRDPVTFLENLMQNNWVYGTALVAVFGASIAASVVGLWTSNSYWTWWGSVSLVSTLFGLTLGDIQDAIRSIKDPKLKERVGRHYNNKNDPADIARAIVNDPERSIPEGVRSKFRDLLIRHNLPLSDSNVEIPDRTELSEASVPSSRKILNWTVVENAVRHLDEAISGPAMAGGYKETPVAFVRRLIHESSPGGATYQKLQTLLVEYGFEPIPPTASVHSRTQRDQAGSRPRVGRKPSSSSMPPRRWLQSEYAQQVPRTLSKQGIFKYSTPAESLYYVAAYVWQELTNTFDKYDADKLIANMREEMSKLGLPLEGLNLRVAELAAEILTRQIGGAKSATALLSSKAPFILQRIDTGMPLPPIVLEIWANDIVSSFINPTSVNPRLTRALFEGLGTDFRGDKGTALAQTHPEWRQLLVPDKPSLPQDPLARMPASGRVDIASTGGKADQVFEQAGTVWRQAPEQMKEAFRDEFMLLSSMVIDYRKARNQTTEATGIHEAAQRADEILTKRPGDPSSALQRLPKPSREYIRSLAYVPEAKEVIAAATLGETDPAGLKPDFAQALLNGLNPEIILSHHLIVIKQRYTDNQPEPRLQKPMSKEDTAKVFSIVAACFYGIEKRWNDWGEAAKYTDQNDLKDLAAAELQTHGLERKNVEEALDRAVRLILGNRESAKKIVARAGFAGWDSAMKRSPTTLPFIVGQALAEQLFMLDIPTQFISDATMSSLCKVFDRMSSLKSRPRSREEFPAELQTGIEPLIFNYVADVMFEKGMPPGTGTAMSQLPEDLRRRLLGLKQPYYVNEILANRLLGQLPEDDLFSTVLRAFKVRDIEGIMKATNPIKSETKPAEPLLMPVHSRKTDVIRESAEELIYFHVAAAFAELWLSRRAVPGLTEDVLRSAAAKRLQSNFPAGFSEKASRAFEEAIRFFLSASLNKWFDGLPEPVREKIETFGYIRAAKELVAYGCLGKLPLVVVRKALEGLELCVGSSKMTFMASEADKNAPMNQTKPAEPGAEVQAETQTQGEPSAQTPLREETTVEPAVQAPILTEKDIVDIRAFGAWLAKRPETEKKAINQALNSAKDRYGRPLSPRERGQFVSNVRSYAEFVSKALPGEVGQAIEEALRAAPPRRAVETILKRPSHSAANRGAVHGMETSRSVLPKQAATPGAKPGAGAQTTLSANTPGSIRVLILRNAVKLWNRADERTRANFVDSPFDLVRPAHFEMQLYQELNNSLSLPWKEYLPDIRSSVKILTELITMARVRIIVEEFKSGKVLLGRELDARLKELGLPPLMEGVSVISLCDFLKINADITTVAETKSYYRGIFTPEALIDMVGKAWFLPRLPKNLSDAFFHFGVVQNGRPDSAIIREVLIALASGDLGAEDAFGLLEGSFEGERSRAQIGEEIEKLGPPTPPAIPEAKPTYSPSSLEGNAFFAAAQAILVLLEFWGETALYVDAADLSRNAGDLLKQRFVIVLNDTARYLTHACQIILGNRKSVTELDVRNAIQVWKKKKLWEMNRGDAIHYVDQAINDAREVNSIPRSFSRGNAKEFVLMLESLQAGAKDLNSPTKAFALLIVDHDLSLVNYVSQRWFDNPPLNPKPSVFSLLPPRAQEKLRPLLRPELYGVDGEFMARHLYNGLRSDLTRAALEGLGVRDVPRVKEVLESLSPFVQTPNPPEPAKQSPPTNSPTEKTPTETKKSFLGGTLEEKVYKAMAETFNAWLKTGEADYFLVEPQVLIDETVRNLRLQSAFDSNAPTASTALDQAARVILGDRENGLQRVVRAALQMWIDNPAMRKVKPYRDNELDSEERLYDTFERRIQELLDGWLVLTPHRFITFAILDDIIVILQSLKEVKGDPQSETDFPNRVRQAVYGPLLKYLVAVWPTRTFPPKPWASVYSQLPTEIRWAISRFGFSAMINEILAQIVSGKLPPNLAESLLRGFEVDDPKTPIAEMLALAAQLVPRPAEPGTVAGSESLKRAA
jgi:hypothetical protein